MQALRAFEATARAQSLTKAAEALNLKHGAISHQIKPIAYFDFSVVSKVRRTDPFQCCL